MPFGLYFDVHIPGTILRGLRLVGVEVLTAQEDGRARSSDPDLLDRSTELSRILVSSDRDLLVEAARRQRVGIRFAGLVHVHPARVTIGVAIRDLELIAKVERLEEFRDRVEFLPL